MEIAGPGQKATMHVATERCLMRKTIHLVEIYSPNALGGWARDCIEGRGSIHSMISKLSVYNAAKVRFRSAFRI